MVAFLMLVDVIKHIQASVTWCLFLLNRNFLYLNLLLWKILYQQLSQGNCRTCVEEFFVIFFSSRVFFCHFPFSVENMPLVSFLSLNFTAKYELFILNLNLNLLIPCTYLGLHSFPSDHPTKRRAKKVSNFAVIHSNQAILHSNHGYCKNFSTDLVALCPPLCITPIDIRSFCWIDVRVSMFYIAMTTYENSKEF